MEVKKIEFLVDSVTFVDGRCHVKGACNRGPLKIGDRFYKAHQVIMKPNSEGGFDCSGRINIREIEVEISKISIYRNQIEELPEGMAAEIVLLGDSCDVLKDKDSLGNV